VDFDIVEELLNLHKEEFSIKDLVQSEKEYEEEEGENGKR
jgi:hypothetical protein